MKNTLILGASEKTERYANMAAHSLLKHAHSILLFGARKGFIEGVEIETVWNPNWEVDTVTLYLGPKNQVPFYEKISKLKPRRVIFNPGTENEEFMEILKANQIQVEVACTLVLLSVNQY